MEVCWLLCRSKLALQAAFQFTVVEAQQSAFRMAENHDLSRAQFVMGERERAQGVLGDNGAGVADDMGLAVASPSACSTCRRASMQVTTASPRAGRRGRYH